MIEIKNRYTGEVITTITNLINANLSNANLSNADLRYANLGNADLRNADLRNADLSNADFRNANLKNANLWNADFRNANLRNANLWNANLINADLSNTNLRNADLWNANLWNANLWNAVLPHFQLPQGDLEVFKAAGGQIVRLLIPRQARRTSCLVNRKCRAEFAHVLAIDGGRSVVTSVRDGVYELGKTVYPDRYCDDFRIDCSHGIHFFLTRKEAEEWAS